MAAVEARFAQKLNYVKPWRTSGSTQRCESKEPKTAYEMLWAEVRNPQRAKDTIRNILRRILESYFTIFGGVDRDDICKTIVWISKGFLLA
jgi:wobble nucleotide-excising tRNase